jgi:hypothetical protein
MPDSNAATPFANAPPTGDAESAALSSFIAPCMSSCNPLNAATGALANGEIIASMPF